MKRLAFALVISALIATAVPLAATHLPAKPNVSPTVAAAVTNYDQYAQTARVLDLTSVFKDPDASAAVRLTTSLGTMNFTLDGQTAPITVANFLRYLDEGRYFINDPATGGSASLFFHRSVPGFVIQTGGFLGTVNPNAPSDNPGQVLPSQVPSFAPIQNEPFISNRRGTIAMAKLGGDPNSATSEWFINLADNSTNLDHQNGGFTVFGRVATGMAVADSIAALPRYNGGGAFSELPVRNYTGNKVPRVGNLVSIPEFVRISPLTFTASSSNADVAAVSVSGTNLLVKAGQQPGTAQITVTATDLDGASVSQTFVVNVVTPPGRLRNISTRVNFAAGDAVLIAGFILRGAAPKQLVVRAIGPSLTATGVPNAITNPTLELHGDEGVITSNDNWRDGPHQQLLSDLNIAPTADAESAVFASVPSSADNKLYTAVMRSAGQQSGVGVVEVYDLDATAGSSILNLSTRGQVGTGSDAMIGGFILGGADSRRLVIRAIGPSLAKQNVAGTLPDPMVELRNSNGVIVDANNDWQTHPQAAEIQSYGLAPGDAKEAAVIATLPEGGYTATISGAGNQPTGVASIEIYQVQ